MRDPDDWPTRDLLSHRAATTPGRLAVVDADADETWTYREFDRRVDRLAAGLGATRGDRVAAVVPPRPAVAALVFATMRVGATLVALDPRETPDELAAKLDRVDADALVCDRETASLALSAAEAADREAGDLPVSSVDELADGRPRPAGAAGAAEAGAAGRAATVYPVALARDDEALVLFTSGTTGEPKGVRLTVGNLVASATASAFRLGVCPGDRWLCCLPMHHTGGLAPAIRATLYGTTVVIQRGFDPAETARVLADREITGVSLVPTMLSRLLDDGWEPPASLRFVLLGGAPATADLIERASAAGVPVCPTYGMTETASQIATATPDEARDRPGTVGHPLAFTEVSVLGDDGDPVGPGERGDLVVSGPTVAAGYLDDDRTAAAFSDRGFRTGDVGVRDDDGRLRIADRRADRIVTGGENVDPAEVADALESHPDVAAAAVVGLADDEWGERVAALVVPGDDGDLPSIDALLARCDERLAGFKRPKTVGFADDLPRTASGTVDREAVRDRLRDEGVDVSTDR